MILYHGSNVPVENPKIIPNSRALDFGCGFYLTSDYEQAAKWAKLTVLRREFGSPTVSVYEFNDDSSDLSVLKFDLADVNWLKYVVLNRSEKSNKDNYDIVSGPVANDNTMPVITLYLSGAYDETEALKRLLTQKLKDQYVFKTEKALSNLTLKEVISLWHEQISTYLIIIILLS